MKQNDLDPRKSLDKHNPKVLSREVYYKGKDIIKQGDDGFRAYYIEKGRVEVLVEDGKHQLKICELTDGDIFGEMALINNDMRSATVRALIDTTVTIISRDEIEGRIKSIKDEPVRALINVLADRLREATMGQLDHYRNLSNFQLRINSFVDDFGSHLDDAQKEAFKEEVKPILKDLESVIEKYQRH